MQQDSLPQAVDFTKAWLNGPLHLDWLDTKLGGRIAMTHCLGRNTIDAKGRQWTRNIAQDISFVSNKGIRIVLSLISLGEMKSLGVADLPSRLRKKKIVWLHFPIEDFGTPKETTVKTWNQLKPEILKALKNQETILIHCAAGLGRTGMIAACLLVASGETPENAVNKVRQARPGTIETDAQMAFIKQADY